MPSFGPRKVHICVCSKFASYSNLAGDLTCSRFSASHIDPHNILNHRQSCNRCFLSFRSKVTVLPSEPPRRVDVARPYVRTYTLRVRVGALFRRIGAMENLNSVCLSERSFLYPFTTPQQLLQPRFRVKSSSQH